MLINDIIVRNLKNNPNNMFKNIFPEKLNRFVYAGVETGQHEVMSQKSEVSQKALNQESTALKNEINRYMEGMKSEKGSTEWFQKEFDQVIADLQSALAALTQGGATRLNLDNVRTKYTGIVYSRNYRMSAEGDPMAPSNSTNAQRVATASEIQADRNRAMAEKAKPNEKVETDAWIKIADLVDEHRNLEFTRAKKPGETPAEYALAKETNETRQAEIAKSLVASAKEVMEPGQTEYISNHLTIRNNPGESTYFFQIERAPKGSSARRMVEKLTIDASKNAA